MRKTKEDAELTRQNLLDAAFRLFLENNYDRTSLEEICKMAQVTRGAAYWHFKNKYEIFECTVKETLNRIHNRVVEQINEDKKKSEEEILVELLWLPNCMTEDFIFIRKVMAYVQGHTEFEKLRSVLLEDKKRQYDYFREPIVRVKERNERLSGLSVDELTYIIFYAFDGTYIQDIPKEIEVKLSKEMIRGYIHLILGE